MPTEPALVLHGFRLSGHSHRAELMLSLLGLDYGFRHVDLTQQEQKGPAFLALNSLGAVPVLVDEGVAIPDSVAILAYLAQRYDPERRWLPTDPLAAARVQRWFSIAQGPVWAGPARARVIKRFGGTADDHARAVAAADAFLPVLDAELAGRAFLAADAATAADVAIYSYVKVAPEGEVSLEPYPAIRAWLERVEALPRFIPMPTSL
ncbi:glutathione S-transferase family protein [Phenylobacterium montanum]|uniref:Glutathione S-transferase N-terminal domain-containing protein n=1 Tax=Phenylobacterium montanum TaxID=2823693 RepID=A0A975FXM4_9CAUL|nr:glutathione S-transferase N-terminal domain-containing protein [Caulobacter sp. S6]QUD86712.1 glutathione S-transferase N-terminal domain-containing protein [Caulobacter sp. S6]